MWSRLTTATSAVPGGKADLAEQAAQQPLDRHRQAVVAAPPFWSSPPILERHHWVKHDAHVTFARDVTGSLADPEQLTQAGSPIAWEELERPAPPTNRRSARSLNGTAGHSVPN